MYVCSSIEDGKNGLPKVLMQSADQTQSCEIYLYGATVTSWVQNGTEKLYLSPIAPFDGKKAIRGGIPLVFPQFGRPDTTLPQHGFARTSTWTLAGTSASSAACSIVFTLKETEDTLAVWPFQFQLEYTVTLTSDGLETKLAITNTDNKDFPCQALLHTYFAIPDVNKLRVIGFENAQYVDQLLKEPDGSVHIATDENQVAVITQEVDRIYIGDKCPNNAVTVCSSIGTTDDDGKDVTSNIARVTRQAYRIPAGSATEEQQQQQQQQPQPEAISVYADCVFWNAWVEKAKGMADLPDEAYNIYVCVEPGLVVGQHVVHPQETLVLSQMLSP